MLTLEQHHYTNDAFTNESNIYDEWNRHVNRNGGQECLKCGSLKEFIKHVHLERTLQIPTNTTLFPRNSKKVSNTNACEELLDDSAFQQPYMYMCAFTGETQSIFVF